MRRKKEYFTCGENDPRPVSAAVTRRVAFSEVDAMAVAWHGNYLRFFEAAHTELMQKVGLGYEAYYAADLAAPMVQSHVDYLSPLKLDEVFTVTATMYFNEGARLDIAYQITGADGRVCARGYTVQMFFGLHDHEVFILVPPLVEKMHQRWKNGEFHD